MSNSFARFCLIGTGDGVRQIEYADDIEDLETTASERGLSFWAVFRNDPGFSGSHQEEFLVYHHDDPYFVNRGIPSNTAL